MELYALEIMRRYLQHVLPKGFQKVRYYGFLSSAANKTFEKIKLLFFIKKNPKEVKTSQKKNEIKVVKCL